MAGWGETRPSADQDNNQSRIGRLLGSYWGRPGIDLDLDLGGVTPSPLLASSWSGWFSWETKPSADQDNNQGRIGRLLGSYWGRPGIDLDLDLGGVSPSPLLASSWSGWLSWETRPSADEDNSRALLVVCWGLKLKTANTMEP